MFQQFPKFHSVDQAKENSQPALNCTSNHKTVSYTSEQ